MFRPNTFCLLRRRSGVINIRGEVTYLRPEKTPCGVVKTAAKLMKSSVRADATSSRGRTDEEQGETRILFPVPVKITQGDIVEIDGFVLSCTQVFPRRNVLGRLDHKDCRFEPGALV